METDNESIEDVVLQEAGSPGYFAVYTRRCNRGESER